MIFYCGYILGIYPAAFLSQKYRPGKVIAALIFVWGFVELSTIWCNYAGIMVQRFLLGFAESGIGPTFIIASGQWYTPAESTFRIGLWFSASNGAASM
jgi:MFS family permease